MSLESLANELLLDFFECLSTNHLLRAFNGLNRRFDSLLQVHFQTHGLDFRSVSKHDFDTTCRKHLPSIVDRVISLHLSDNNDSPQQTDWLLAHGFTLRQFAHVRSLSLHHIFSVRAMNKIMLEWCHMPNLTHLSLYSCDLGYSGGDVLNIVNTIWSLPKLTYCYFDIGSNGKGDFRAPTVVSLSLKYLSIRYMECNLAEMIRLFNQTPRLRHLSTHITPFRYYDLPSISSSLNTLKIMFSSERSNILVDLSKYMPNLCHLTVQTYGETYIDGHQWKQIISDHFPNLTRFHLTTEFKFPSNDNKERIIDDVLESFRSQFWLEEHRWFVRCHWNPGYDNIHLCTLPSAFEFLDAYFPLLTKSTGPPDDDDHWSYDHLHHLTYQLTFSKASAPPHIRFPNIRFLIVSLPVFDHFWSIVPNFDQLTSIEVLRNDFNSNRQSWLQALFDRAPNISSISFSQYTSTHSTRLLLEITSKSIRRLDFSNDTTYYNTQECAALSRSPLGIQCEVLFINVKKWTCVLDLVHTMINLRVLKVRCHDDKWDAESTVMDDKLAEWLRNRLSSACTVGRDRRLKAIIVLIDSHLDRALRHCFFS